MTQEENCGTQLLCDLSSFISRYVALSSAQGYACALWAKHTHTLDATDFTPYLDINSPVLRSGKTRLLEVLRLLVRNPWFTGRVTGSALVRKVDKDHPTLLLDESDAAFQTRGDYGEALRGILNAGFERDGTYSMCVQKGNDWEPRDFKTFSAKAVAGIGHLPATIRDRSIPIRLKRAKRSENVKRFRKSKIRPEGEQLRQRIEEWAKTNTAKLREVTPELPDELNDRQQDVCEPLLAIADLAGGVWPARARAALIELCTGFMQPDDSTGLRLLADIRDIFATGQTDRLPTYRVLDCLQQCQESPWGEFDHGRPLSAFQLSKLLRSFDVRPRDIRFEQGVQKGYLRSDFEDSWDRYLGSEHGSEGQQGQQTSVHAGQRDLGEGQQAERVAGVKNAESSVNTQVVADVAPLSPPWNELGEAPNPKAEINVVGLNHCRIHPRNKTEWWLRGGVDPVCSICHPNPT
jgi:hypothetical protein